MFIHLHCHSAFSFLDGAVRVESLVAQAAMFSMPAIALTDHNTIAGLPMFHRFASVYGIKPISGAEVTLEDGSHLTLLAETRVGYANLCRLLTVAHGDLSSHGGPSTGDLSRELAAQRRNSERRRQPRLAEQTLFNHAAGLIVLSGCRNGPVARAILRRRYSEAAEIAKTYARHFAGSFYIELQDDAYPQSPRLMARLAELAETQGLPLVATGNVHYTSPQQFPVHDVLSCIRLRCNIRTPHADRPLNGARFLFDEREAARRFAKYPEAIANTMRIADRCEVVVKLNQSLFPEFRLPEGQTNAREFLRARVYEGARERYPRVDEALQTRLNHELSIIEQLGYVDYFLVVWDIVDFARKRRIRCAGRGSAADSAVAYCLYITDVDAAGRGLLFERFMSLERAERPDIDIDFDSRRRDEVIQYVYDRYGAEHVARVATYQTFRGRSAIREVGTALGLPDDLLDGLAKRVPWMAHADKLEGLFNSVPELKGLSDYRQQLTWLWPIAAEIAGFPRHLGMHLGGVVISRLPLYETTSLQPSAKGEWMTPFDKDAAEDVGLVKLDLLSLRTMSAIEDTVVLRERQGKPLDYDEIPLDDAATFEMLGTGDTIGVFQLESPAQRGLQARLRPDRLEDIVASVALIRPGPIKGNMVDPFIERRRGLAPISYLHPKLEPILGKTFGVVLFQEQVIEIATAIANFTPGEADQLRRVMSHARSAQEMEKIGAQFLQKAGESGVDPEVAQTIFSYIQGYASYGFCEAHAAAFAATAYKTAYLVRHYPAEFYASILNQYPMGYYPVHVICAEARRRGIEIRGIDVNVSEWQCFVEDEQVIRLGFCLVKGFRQELAEALCEQRRERLFSSVLDCLARVSGMDSLLAERLVRCGGFDGVPPYSRKQVLWELPHWLATRSESMEATAQLDLTFTEQSGSGAWIEQDFTLATRLLDEYNLLGVGTSGHWLTLLRPWLEESGYIRAEQLGEIEDGSIVIAAGLLVRPHRPPTKSGKTVVFFTLEDETGFIDATMFESIYHASGAILFTPYGRLIGLRGKVERRGGGRPQMIVQHVWSLTSGISS